MVIQSIWYSRYDTVDKTSSPNNLICKTKEHLFVHIWKGDLHDICKIPVSFYEKVRKDTHYKTNLWISEQPRVFLVTDFNRFICMISTTLTNNLGT